EILCNKDDEEILIYHDLITERKLTFNEPVDVVYTWVNDQDPEWLKKCNHFKNIADNYGKYALDIARFSNHNELYYSVKSVFKYIPWVRNVYIVTDQQAPSWIGEFERIKVVDHKDIIAEDYLPTFNSHVIEAHLYKINGLSENFIYFNDDVFVARELPVGHFYKSNGLSSLFISNKSISDMLNRNVISPTLSASVMGKNMLKKDFDVDIDSPLVHTYVPLKKSMFKKVWESYEREIKSFLPNKFRSNADLNLATFLVPWFSYIQGGATLSRDICYYFNIRSPAASNYYRMLKEVKGSDACPHSFCANDFTTTYPVIENYHSLLITTLDYYFDGDHS
ncbi:TPA: Stealth CR1 domain-containing protein, partial [Kluyvera georgiana]